MVAVEGRDSPGDGARGTAVGAVATEARAAARLRGVQGGAGLRSFESQGRFMWS